MQKLRTDDQHNIRNENKKSLIQHMDVSDNEIWANEKGTTTTTWEKDVDGKTTICSRTHSLTHTSK